MVFFVPLFHLARGTKFYRRTNSRQRRRRNKIRSTKSCFISLAFSQNSVIKFQGNKKNNFLAKYWKRFSRETKQNSVCYIDRRRRREITDFFAMRTRVLAYDPPCKANRTVIFPPSQYADGNWAELNNFILSLCLRWMILIQSGKDGSSFSSLKWNISYYLVSLHHDAIECFKLALPATHETHRDYEFLMFQQQYVLQKNVVAE